MFHNKPMRSLTAGNINSIILYQLIEFLIEISLTNAKLEQTCKLQRCYKNFDKTKFRNNLDKINQEENCSNPDSNVNLVSTFSVNNKLMDKHTPYIITKSNSSFTSKPWITKTISNSTTKKQEQDLQKNL